MILLRHGIFRVASDGINYLTFVPDVFNLDVHNDY